MCIKRGQHTGSRENQTEQDETHRPLTRAPTQFLSTIIPSRITGGYVTSGRNTRHWQADREPLPLATRAQRRGESIRSLGNRIERIADGHHEQTQEMMRLMTNVHANVRILQRVQGRARDLVNTEECLGTTTRTVRELDLLIVMAEQVRGELASGLRFAPKMAQLSSTRMTEAVERPARRIMFTSPSKEHSSPHRVLV